MEEEARGEHGMEKRSGRTRSGNPRGINRFMPIQVWREGGRKAREGKGKRFWFEEICIIASLFFPLLSLVSALWFGISVSPLTEYFKPAI
eukprot:scaffold119249_cov30-Tisochrysis_lutea.AAC.3